MKNPGVHRDKRYSSTEIIKILEDDGWELWKTEGSHYQYKHHSKKGKVTVKHPDKDVPIKTERSIWKQAGLL